MLGVYFLYPCTKPSSWASPVCPLLSSPSSPVGVGGIFFLLGAAFTLGPSRVDFLLNIGTIGSIVSHVLGWLMVIVGAFRCALDVILEKDVPGMLHTHSMRHRAAR